MSTMNSIVVQHLPATYFSAYQGLRDELVGDFEVDDFSPPPAVQLDIYKEALLIFYGKVTVYLRSMGKALPRRWQEWIG